MQENATIHVDNCQDILNLYQRHVQKTRIVKDELWGLCPFHSEKSPSFSANLKNSKYHCFGCGASGNALTFCRKVGEPYTAFRTSGKKNPTYEAEQLVLRQTEDEFQRFCWDRLIFLTDLYRDAQKEIEVCEVAIRQSRRSPSLYSGRDKIFWIKRKFEYEQILSSIESDLDVYTYDSEERYQQIRFQDFLRVQESENCHE